jgi:murein DD-endopeptidase MepM/ murein hydrolase activator NlpD
MSDVRKYIFFLKSYSISRLLITGQIIESVKDVIVAILVVKRGKYSASFLNTFFFLLSVCVLIVGPAIAENNPFSTADETEQTYFQSSGIEFDPFDNSISTIISAKHRDKVITYTVKSGDTLAQIANTFKITVDTIKWANNLKSDTITAGDELQIPPVTGVVHKVASGDNIYTIAKKYNVDAQNIVNFPFNDFADPDSFLLTPGQVLYIPGGTIEIKPVYQPGVSYYAKIQAGVQGTSAFLWPTSGIITSYPVSYHMALDIANAAAPPILASDTGTVTFAGCLNWGYGCHIIIDHGNGYQSLYGHLSSIEASPGQAVSKGQRIGIMGSTGRSTGTHLHFEIRSGGVLLNPLNFLK